MKFLNGFQIVLSKVPTYPDFSQNFKEEIDIALANHILQSEDPRISDESRTEFSKLVACINPETGCLPVRYCPRYGFGRYYPEIPKELTHDGKPNKMHGVFYGGLIQMPRVIKNTLFHYGGWTDIDQKKGHITIIVDVAAKAKMSSIRTTALQDYLADGRFEEYVHVLSEYYSADPANPLQKKHIKLLFNRTIYGGGFKGWIEEVESGKLKSGMDGDNQIWSTAPVPLKNKTTKHQLYDLFAHEIGAMIDQIYLSNTELQAVVCSNDLAFCDTDSAEMRSSKLHSRKSRVMSYFCQIIEHDITYHAIKFAIKKKLIRKCVFSHGYDGFTVPQTGNGDSIVDHLDTLNEYVRKQTGLPTVCFMHKQFEECELLHDALELRGTEPAVLKVSDDMVSSHRDASKKIYAKIRDSVCYTNGSVYMRVEGTNYWICDQSRFTAKLLLLIADSPFRRAGRDPTTKEAVKDQFLEDQKEAAQVAKFIMAEIMSNPDDTFYENFHETTKGRIAFQDGVYDFPSNRFYKWADITFPYFTCVMIPYKGADVFENKNRDAMAEIKTSIFDTLFGLDATTALQMLARNVAGHWGDKVFSAYMGNRDCGKGVLQKLNSQALGTYIQSIDVANLVCVRAVKCDNAKEKSWALPLEFARITFGQESSDADVQTKYNGNIIKSLCSGTDSHKARKLYANIQEFKVQSSIMLLANDQMLIEPADTWEKGFKFSSTIQFKTQQFIDAKRAAGACELAMAMYRVGDDSILSRCSSNEWKYAYIHLLIEHYSKNKVAKVKKIDEEDVEITLRDQILESFTITPRHMHKVTNDTLKHWMSEKNIKCSATKLHTELKSMGCSPYHSGNTRGFEGLFRIAVAEDDTEGDDDSI